MHRPAGLGPKSLVLYDVSTLYFETDAGDGFRESGFSKERRLEPQTTIGLLTDADGFPLWVEAFEGNKAETTTMLPTIRSFMAAHRLTDVTIVADAGMVSDGNKKALEAAGLSFSIRARIPDVPYVVQAWRTAHRGEGPAVGRPGSADSGVADRRPRDHTIVYQYRADRARRTLRGIDEQVGKAQKASAHRLLAVDALADDVGVAGVLGGLGDDVHERAAGAAGGVGREPRRGGQRVRRVEVDGADQLVGAGGDFVVVARARRPGSRRAAA